MSTAYRTEPTLPWDKLWSDLPAGVSEEVTGNTTPTFRCLTDGEGFLWADSCRDGADTGFERFGGNYKAADHILDLIADHFGVVILSEHDEGFFTPEELAEAEFGD